LTGNWSRLLIGRTTNRKPASSGKKRKNDRDPWNGFDVGSWVIQSESLTKDGETTTERIKLTRVKAKERDRIQLQGLKEGKNPESLTAGNRRDGTFQATTLHSIRNPSYWRRANRN
jgi:hypothetical protein